MQYNFEWDPAKAKANYRKDRVRFERAAEVFTDELMLSL
ncbi:MAG: BrnT family toxin [Ignavibacteria bacterium]|nr:BrnT family toxin [Ignavibacteria bacterium]